MSTAPGATARFLEDLESSLWVGGATGLSSSAEIFDAGRDGLRFFASFGPPYARYRSTVFDFDRDIVARYDAQREIAFGRLRADAERLRELSAAMTEVSLDFRDAAAPLFGSWAGRVADRARDQVAGLLDSAGSAWVRLAALADTIDAAVGGVERMAVDKAKAVRALALEHVGGLDAEQVELLVDCVAGGTALTDAQLADLAELCELDVNPAVCRANRDLLEQAAADVRGWLDHAFVPVFEARANVFDAACAAAESTMSAAWDELRARLDTMAGEPLDVSTVRAAADAAPAAIPPTAPPSGSATPPPAEPGSGAQPAADVPDEGQRVGLDAMAPQAAGPTPVAPAALPVAPPAAGTGGTFFYGGVPFVGAAGAPGGGDREHTRRVPLAGGTFGDPDAPAGTDRDVLGGETDETNYSDDARPESDTEPRLEPEAPRLSVDDILGDEEDLW